MKKPIPKLDISNSIRSELRFYPSGGKQTVYIFNCLDCNVEFEKTAYYAKKSSGFCKKCAPSHFHKKEISVFSEKECSECHQVRPYSDYAFTGGNKHKKSICTQCSNLKKTFGINSEQYNELSNNQNNMCYICKSKESHITKDGKSARLAVDHCHKTGKIRGLLCGNCNKGLGSFKDSIELLKNAIFYLEKNNES